MYPQKKKQASLPTHGLISAMYIAYICLHGVMCALIFSYVILSKPVFGFEN